MIDPTILSALGGGDLPSVAGQSSGPLLIMGGAQGLCGDLARFAPDEAP